MPKATPIEIWFQDEARIGQKNGLVRQWARRGTRPRQPADQRYENAKVAPGAHAVLIFDRAGWHTTPELRMPANVTPIWLPSRSPELNPVENVWQYLRQNWLSNRVFETYDDIIDAACEAWNNLTAQPAVITSIGMREWAHVGHT